MKKITIISILTACTLLLFIMTGCGRNAVGAATRICPQYECVLTSVPAEFSMETVQLSGKGPTLWAGDVVPEVIVINRNNQPAHFTVTFNCLNKHSSKRELVNAGSVWLQPQTSQNVQGKFRVGQKENWECTADITASTINGCALKEK